METWQVCGGVKMIKGVTNRERIKAGRREVS